MDRVERVLVLMCTASERVRAGQGQLRWWSDSGVRTAIQRHRGSLGQSSDSKVESDEPEGRTEQELLERWWVQWPSKLRLETDREDSPALRIVNGQEWWSMERSGRVLGSAGYAAAFLNRGFVGDLLDPSAVIAAVALTEVTETSHEGEPAFVATAMARSTLRQIPPRSLLLASFVDSYRLVVHAKLGVLLRAESILAGAPVQVVEMVQPVFSDTLDDALFRFETPPGVTVEPAPDATGRLADGTKVDRADYWPHLRRSQTT